MSKIFDWDARNGTLIDSVSKTKGTLTAGTGGFKKTEKGLAMDFDGSATLVNYGDINDITTGDFSLESYIKIKSISATQVIFGKRSSAIGYAMRLTSGGLLQGVIEDSGGAATSTADGTSLEDNSWHHLIITFDRDGNMTRYVDGLLYGTADDISSRSGTLTNAVNLQIGASSVPNQYFNGYTGKAKLYDHILTAQERSNLYNEFLHSYPVEKTKHFNALNVVNKPTDLSNQVDDTQSANLISNNDFETDTSNWQASRGSIAVSTEQSHSGTKSCKWTWNNVDNADSGIFGGSYNIDVGKKYRAGVWVYIPSSNGSNTIKLWADNTSNSGNYTPSATSQVIPVDTWTYVEWYGEITQNSGGGKIVCYLVNPLTSGDVFYIDSVVMSEYTGLVAAYSMIPQND